jgi:membrane-associated protease RseP (regulator of RpoE activity)
MQQGCGACSGLRAIHVVALLYVVVATAALLSARTAWGDSEDEKLARQIELRLTAQSLDVMVGYAIRLKRVSEPIRLHGAPLCGDKLAPVLGVVVANRDELPWALHDPAQDRFDLDGRVRALWVLPEFPADLAGLQVGDVIRSVNGKTIENSSEFRKFKFEEDEQILIKVERDETFLTLEVENWPGCYSPADLSINSQINAYADGEQMIFYTGFLRFFADDDDLALVVGHELAHNVLEHVGKWGGAGHEAQADYFGAYFAARAGFSVSDAENVERKLSLLSIYSSAPRSARSHPTGPARLLALRATVEEINSKIASDSPLEPDFWE